MWLDTTISLMILVLKKFVFKCNLENKFYDFLMNIKEKSSIDNIDYVYESGNSAIEYL